MIRRSHLLLVLSLCVLPATAAASSRQESMFQDDDMLEFSEPANVARTVNALAALGVDRIRLSVFWVAVAPTPNSQTKPGGGFDPANPDTYPNGSWTATTRWSSSPRHAASASCST